eukprot:gene27552-63531_t
MPPRWKHALLCEKKRIAALHKWPPYVRFLACYRAFVAEVLAPLIGDQQGLVFQHPPTLRVIMPSRKASIGTHTD